MSLRARLLAIIGTALLLLWSVAAAWMMRDLERSLQRTLDERLAMSAQMVSGLFAQSVLSPGASPISAHDSLVIPGGRGMVCQVRSLRGEVIASTGEPNHAPLQIATPGYRTLTTDRQRWRTYTLLANGFYITTADRLDERSLLLRRVAVAAGVPFLIAAIGGLVALWIGVGRALAPLRGLQKQLQERTPNELEPVRSGPIPSELRPLIAALNELLSRVGRAIQRERTFTSAAAHELRTPLTAITTHLQVAQLTDGEAAAGALADAALGVTRMRGTLDQLLMLARVEGNLSFDDGERVSAQEALERALLAVAGTGGRIRPSQLRADSILCMPAPLAVVAVRNLLDNALKYSPSDQSVEVDIEVGDLFTTFWVRDHGPGMSEVALANATRRFWRESPAGPGVGLGLALSLAVAERFGGRLELRNSEDVGLEASVTLPSKATIPNP